MFETELSLLCRMDETEDARLLPVMILDLTCMRLVCGFFLGLTDLGLTLVPFSDDMLELSLLRSPF